MHRQSPMRRCSDLARIVGGTPAVIDGACLIQLLRADLSPTILGVPTHSPLVLPVFFSIEGARSRANTLNLGEAVLLQEEANTVIKVLRDLGILVTAFHNHWQFEQPRLMYLHWSAIMEPERFLRASMAALRAAGVRTRPLTPPAGQESSGHESSGHESSGSESGKPVTTTFSQHRSKGYSRSRFDQ